MTVGSRGIGAATVRAVHADGASVVLHHGSGERAARAVADDLGDRVALVQGDLLAPGAADGVWSAAVAVTGRVDVLVNNAGAWRSAILHFRLALTKGIARGYAHQNVLAYAVAPGWVATDIAVIAFLATGRARHATGRARHATGSPSTSPARTTSADPDVSA